MTGDDILKALYQSEAAVTAYTHIAEAVRIDDRSLFVSAAADLFAAAQAPACAEAEERVEDLELALAQTIEALDRLAGEVAAALPEMKESVEHARKFAERVRELWRSR